MTGKWNRGIPVVAALAALVLAALPLQLAAAELVRGDPNIAALSISAGSVSFAPQVSFEEMTLTVAGGGYSVTRSFRFGQTASFAPVDAEGFQLPDGTYNWELVMSPRARDLDPRAFSSGEVSADGRAFKAAEAPEGQRQSGVFTIKDGLIVDPRRVEPEATRAAGSIGGVSQSEQPSAASRSAEQIDRDGN